MRHLWLALRSLPTMGRQGHPIPKLHRSLAGWESAPRLALHGKSRYTSNGDLGLSGPEMIDSPIPASCCLAGHDAQRLRNSGVVSRVR